MIHGTRLRNSAEVDTWVNGSVRAKLALFSAVQARIISPKRFVRFTIRFIVERQDRDGSHLAIARGNTEVPGNILTRALGALVDAPTCALLRRRIGIERAFAVDAFADHEKPLGVGGWVEQLQDITLSGNFALGEIICDLTGLIVGWDGGNLTRIIREYSG